MGTVLHTLTHQGPGWGTTTVEECNVFKHGSQPYNHFICTEIVVVQVYVVIRYFGSLFYYGLIVCKCMTSMNRENRQLQIDLE